MDEQMLEEARRIMAAAQQPAERLYVDGKEYVFGFEQRRIAAIVRAARALDAVLYGQTSGYTRAGWQAKVAEMQLRLHEAIQQAE